ncbi:hypothetical protein EI94DRAFT_1729185 [Lactarius quietus]|nr:hypothetical protein EI94DRAFT_1729161 [Lactarius quietus]KAF8267875.1 hypothetical protein EI94DRAFT_1729185 [Lactarius quietus]
MPVSVVFTFSTFALSRGLGKLPSCHSLHFIPLSLRRSMISLKAIPGRKIIHFDTRGDWIEEDGLADRDAFQT